MIRAWAHNSKNNVKRVYTKVVIIFLQNQKCTSKCAIEQSMQVFYIMNVMFVLTTLSDYRFL
jgi:hypothetical protein